MPLPEMIEQALGEHHQAINGFVASYGDLLIQLGGTMAESLREGRVLLSCGNGGSACDAMHFAGECVGRFVNDRRALPAMALSADPGIITAIGNDYGFEQIFSRQVEAHGRVGDWLIAISTSGQSPNIIQAIKTAKMRQLHTVLLTGEKGRSHDIADYVLAVPSGITAHIQETHIFVLQLIIAIIESKLFK